jgi:hypothetical protein
MPVRPWQRQHGWRALGISAALNRSELAGCGQVIPGARRLDRTSRLVCDGMIGDAHQRGGSQ